MSLYVEWLNRIKEGADSTWLCDSQRQVYECILSTWHSAPFVNIYGPPGCGKTFIARLLAKEHAYTYTHSLHELTTPAEQVIVDDAAYSRMMRPLARELNLGRVVLLTRLAVSDPMPAAGLQLDARDVQQVLHVLWERALVEFTATNPAGTDLGQILRAEAIARGGCHVA